MKKADILPPVFDPREYFIDTPGITQLGLGIEIAVTDGDLFVNDLRAADDPSFAAVPFVHNYAELKQYFNLANLSGYGWTSPTVVAGALVFTLIGFYLRSGPAAYIPKFMKEDGTPFEGVRVVRSWPGAPAPQGGEVYRPPYAANGVAGWTNSLGDIGFGYGGDSVLGPGNIGPDMIFPLTPAAPTPPQFGDAAGQLGWHGATNHLTANPVFRLVRKSGGTPPPSNGSDYVRILLDGAEVKILAIPPRSNTTHTVRVEVYVENQLVGEWQGAT